MTHQTIPADPVRKITAAMRAAMRRDEHTYSDAEFLSDMSDYIRALEALLPAPNHGAGGAPDPPPAAHRGT